MNKTIRRSHLLIQEPPLQVLPSLCTAIGLERAIIVQQLHYWLDNSKVKGVARDGYKWIENSYKEWQENFPWWSLVTIKRHFIVLEKMGLVVGRQFNLQDRDAKKAYRLDYAKINELDGINLIRSDRIKLIRRMVSKRSHVKRNPESLISESEEDGDTAEKNRNDLEKRCELVAELLREVHGEGWRIVPLMKRIIVNFCKTYPDPSWYRPAFEIMAKNCKGEPSFTYVESVCENWAKHGFGSRHPDYKTKGNSKQPHGEKDEDTFMQELEVKRNKFKKESA